MELIIKEAGVRLDKALADLTELSRSQANDEIKKEQFWSTAKLLKRNILSKLVMLSLTKCQKKKC